MEGIGRSSPGNGVGASGIDRIGHPFSTDASWRGRRGGAFWRGLGERSGSRANNGKVTAGGDDLPLEVKPDMQRHQVQIAVIVALPCRSGYWDVKEADEMKLDRPKSEGVQKVIEEKIRYCIGTASYPICMDGYNGWRR